MASSERPEGQPGREQTQPPYYQAARFAGDADAGQAYLRAQEAIFRDPHNDLSAYRLQLNQIWHVAVLGEQPPSVLDRRLKRILAAGEPVRLPEEILKLLLERRARASQAGAWVERHHWPGERL
jgi:hypothetical protein